jgi:hypothetical protein
LDIRTKQSSVDGNIFNFVSDLSRASKLGVGIRRISTNAGMNENPGFGWPLAMSNSRREILIEQCVPLHFTRNKYIPTSVMAEAEAATHYSQAIYS